MEPQIEPRRPLAPVRRVPVIHAQVDPSNQGWFDPTTFLPVSSPPPGTNYSGYAAYEMSTVADGVIGQFVEIVNQFDTWRWKPLKAWHDHFKFEVKPAGFTAELTPRVDFSYTEDAFVGMSGTVDAPANAKVWVLSKLVSGSYTPIGHFWRWDSGLRWTVKTSYLSASNRIPVGTYHFDVVQSTGPFGGTGYSLSTNAPV